MMDDDASRAKSAERVEGPASSPAMPSADEGPVRVAATPGRRGKAEGSGKRVPKTRRAVQRRPRKRKRRKRKKAEPILDMEGRAFPPRDARSTGADGRAFVDRTGRPYAIKDNQHAIDTLVGLGAIMATTKEAARVLRITEPTLFAFFKRVPAARDAYEGGKEEGKASLRRQQFSLAKTNATMAIFLGLNYLEQRDRREVVGSPNAPPIKHEHTHSAAPVAALGDLSELSLDELARLYVQQAQKKS